MDSLISVVIPVYNAEKYLEECLESVSAQTWSNMEIILVEDGSTDSSYQIIERFQKKHTNVKVVLQNNGGVGKARNTGLAFASGEYIVFCDSDDVIAPNMIENMYKKMVHTNSELCCCRFVVFKDSDKFEFQDSDMQKAFKGDARYRLVIEEPQYGGYIGNKMFQRNIIEENGLKFNEKIAILEDEIFVLQYLSYCNSLCVTDAKLYAYRQSASSSLKQSILPKRITSVCGREQIYLSMCQYTTDRAIHAVTWNDMMREFAISYKKLLFIRTDESMEWRDRIKKSFRDYIGCFALDKRWNLKERVYFWALYLASWKK